MIRMIQSQSAGHAKEYFSEALLKADYYIGDQELNGTFQGLLSKRLGITGPATKERFFALCENRHPETGKPLTPRTKKDRTVGYDINFHVPKSVSIIHALAEDGHVLDAFQNAVTSTMVAIEQEARARVRKGGKYSDRKTGELLWVDFIHQTARPVENFVPDPHLHAHCYAFNFTWDDTEKQIKACQFRHINKEMPYFQAMFHKSLADNLMRLGYKVRPTAKSFEVEGVSQDIISLFSKRTDEIGRIAKEKGITDAKELSELGARTRARKQKGLSMGELREEWRKQILQLDPVPIEPISVKSEQVKQAEVQLIPASDPLLTKKCVDYALSHCFERASVVAFNKLVQTAITYSIGLEVSINSLVTTLRDAPALIQIADGDQILCTTKDVLLEEQKMVQLANGGRNRHSPLYTDLPFMNATGQQKDAIAHILTSSDMVSIVRGAAGAGKTTLMKEAVKLINEAGKQVITVAPTARASRGVLRDEGFSKAETVALFLIDKKMQEQVKGQIIWVDEAGMLGTKDMAALLKIATEQKARIILGGDTRQHASVVRGDALRVLNTVGGIRVAEVDKIYRQKDVVYRGAVADIAKGDLGRGFEKLEQIGAIREHSRNHANDALVADYITTLKAGKDVLMICPTHDEGEKITSLLREKLRKSGLLGKREIAVERLKNQNLTEAEKTDWRNFKPGTAIQFNQNQKGIKRGSIWQVLNVEDGVVSIISDKRETSTVDLSKPEHFDVFERRQLLLAKGDRVQITKNGFDKDKRRLDNGTVLEVLTVNKNGNVILLNTGSKAEYKIDKNYGHINHAHCITSHASQGKTVDAIFVAQAAATFPATNAKQFYVSVSRAREQVNVYTDDKETLLYYASQIGDRQSATELVNRKFQETHIQAITIEAQKSHAEIHPLPQIDIGKTHDKSLTMEDYEPGF